MRLIEFWVATPLAKAIGWTLIHSLWQGTLISAALATALLVLRSSRARYAAACGAILVTLVAVTLTFLWLLPVGLYGFRSAAPPNSPLWNVPTIGHPADASTAGYAALVPWLTPLWILGVWAFAVRQAAGLVSVLRLRREGVCCAPEHWQNVLARLRAQLRLSRPVQLLQSCLAEIPVVVGHIRPVILVPIGLLTGLPPEQTEAILLHELAHVHRCDYLVNILQRVVETLFFYHPAVWWISRVIRTERENCCDDVVVSISGNARGYAIALTALEQNRCAGRQPVPAITGGSLTNRVRRLLYPKAPAGLWSPLIAALILLATAVAAVAAWPSKPERDSSSVTQQQKNRDAISPYDKWLSEDVVYIIAPEERAAFQKLTTDEERNKFIEQFWDRRNPHPGSPTNAFKDEHYRRIAYANKHFASKKPGWQTDRGHIYIVYGPPDQIDSHPQGGKYARPGQAERSGATTYPFEDWIYRQLPGIGKDVIVEFVDRSRTGDYELVHGPAKSGSS